MLRSHLAVTVTALSLIIPAAKLLPSKLLKSRADNIRANHTPVSQLRPAIMLTAAAHDLIPQLYLLSPGTNYPSQLFHFKFETNQAPQQPELPVALEHTIAVATNPSRRTAIERRLYQHNSIHTKCLAIIRCCRSNTLPTMQTCSGVHCVSLVQHKREQARNPNSLPQC